MVNLFTRCRECNAYMHADTEGTGIYCECPGFRMIPLKKTPQQPDQREQRRD